MSTQSPSYVFSSVNVNSVFWFRHTIILSTSLTALTQSADAECKYVATGGDDTVIRLYSAYGLLTDKPVARFQGHDLNVFFLSFSSDERHLLSTGLDGKILLYDYLQGIGNSSISDPIRHYRSHQGSVKKLSWRSGSPHVFFSSSEDGTMGLWDTRVGDPQGFAANYEHSTCTAHPVNPDYVLMAGDTLELWDLRKMEWLSNWRAGTNIFALISPMLNFTPS